MTLIEHIDNQIITVSVPIEGSYSTDTWHEFEDVEINLKEVLIVDEASLMKGHETLPRYIGWISWAIAITEGELAQTKDFMDNAYTIAASNAMTTLEANGQRVTDKKLKFVAESDSEYIEWKEAYIGIASRLEVQKALLEAFKVKGDSLMNLSATLRKEMAMVTRQR